MVFTDYYHCYSDTMNLGCGKYFVRMRYRRNDKKMEREKIYENSRSKDREDVNTFAAIVDLSRFNNSCLRLLKISDDNNE
jgi:hypothetical protein